MKKIILFILISVFTHNLFAIDSADTISVNQKDITKWIIEKTVNNNGNPTIKYYAIYKGELINTNKTTVNKAKLCDKYKAKCALILITNKGRKRIVLN